MPVAAAVPYRAQGLVAKIDAKGVVSLGRVGGLDWGAGAGTNFRSPSQLYSLFLTHENMGVRTCVRVGRFQFHDLDTLTHTIILHTREQRTVTNHTRE